VRSLFSSALSLFLTPGGVLLMGVLDTSLVFFMPMGLDVVVVLMAARNPGMAWLYAALAATGALIGSAITYWIGRTAGEKGLERFVPEKRLDRVRQKVENSAPPAVAALALIPPPFPLTPFVLAAGAFGLDAWRFFASLAAFKAVRYGTASLLAVQFGTRITDWMETPAFKTTIGAFVAVIVAGTVFSAVKLWRSTRERQPQPTEA
jgi:membrane protein YqaA with SNARE-associated domain